MAFPEDTDYTPSGFQPSQKSSVMQLESVTLFAILLQFGLGILAIMYALPGFIVGVLLFPLFAEMTTAVSLIVYLAVWGVLPILGLVQIYYGYKFYKRTPNIIGSAKQVNIFTAILFGIDTIISAFEGNLLEFPEVMLYLGGNIVLIYLLTMPKVRQELDFQERSPSDFQTYY